jgi:hypothetical protein
MAASFSSATTIQALRLGSCALAFTKNSKERIESEFYPKGSKRWSLSQENSCSAKEIITNNSSPSENFHQIAVPEQEQFLFWQNNMKSNTDPSAQIASIHCSKRSPAQRAADLVFIEPHVVRGKTQAEISELLAAARPYRISRSQVSYDIVKLKNLWIASAVESYRSAIASELRKLDAVEREAWSCWDESKSSESGANPAFTRQVLDVHDRRVRLMGLSAPARHELCGPKGGAITIETRNTEPLDTAAKHELFMRHMARLSEERRDEEAATSEQT